MTVKLTWDFRDYTPFTALKNQTDFRTELKIAFESFVEQCHWDCYHGKFEWRLKLHSEQTYEHDVWKDELPVSMEFTSEDFEKGIVEEIGELGSDNPDDDNEDLEELRAELAKWEATIQRCKQKLAERDAELAAGRLTYAERLAVRRKQWEEKMQRRGKKLAA
jgi:hypothetical protein